MNDLLREWIPAYYDGELSADRREQVEAHLADCAACRADLAELSALSDLLQEAPLVSSEPAEAFARRVVHNLPGRRERFAARALRFALRATPVALFAAWVFWQSVAVLSQGLVWVVGLVPGAGQTIAGLFPPAGSPSSDYGTLGMNLLGGLLGISPIETSWLSTAGAFTIISLLMGLVFVVLFLGWLAGWWAYQRSIKMQS